MTIKKSLLALSLLAMSGVSHAGLVTFNGDTTGEPTWNRPVSGVPPVNLSGFATDVPYQATSFIVDLGGLYSMETTVGDFDTYLFLYEDSFDPNNQFSNVLAGNDDGGTGLLSLINFDLSANAPYWLVVTGFSNSSFGSYTAQISGQGNITVNGQVPAPVPEPFSLALMGLGLAALAAVRRRKLGV